MKKLILPALIIAVIVGGFYVCQQKNKSALPDNIAQSNGRLELERYDVASLYAGRIQAMHVDEGSDVKAGDILAELSSETVASRVEEAQAGERAAKEAVQRAQAGVKQAQEAVARADAQIAAQLQQQKLAQMELNNASQLQSDSLVSPAETQRRRSQRDGAAAAVKAAQAAKAEAMAAMRQAQAQVAEAQAGVAARQAQVKAAQAANNDMAIVSPKDGRVEYKIAEVGNVIGAGSKVVSLLDPSDVSMSIFLPNAQIGSLKVGDEARIVLDGIDAVFPAKISFIATEAQFTPKNVETANERAKLMFKVKLKVPSETALKYKGLLKGGMTGNGFVRTNQGDWSADLAVRLPKE
ncbi:HlyD family efflux transporter periplasmic adaptor subunit [Wielerella bovis]|uniref:HlyD family secretion protein n=1 Tax=Wielerella bovis TaxID=2917790 RepID=UPI002019D408|nr:HlyD family efflux transporter periplasmic adaptor subunit [Wielerella bovis]ULJ62442.1 HlyD family efflux transporter periplasmic adaptor subunit [Wielerella bovis]